MDQEAINQLIVPNEQAVKKRGRPRKYSTLDELLDQRNYEQKLRNQNKRYFKNLREGKLQIEN